MKIPYKYFKTHYKWFDYDGEDKKKWLKKDEKKRCKTFLNKYIQKELEYFDKKEGL
jgi:hypothetical protein